MYTIEYVNLTNGHRIREYGFSKRLFRRMHFLMNRRNEYTLEERYNVRSLRRIPCNYKTLWNCMVGKMVFIRKEEV